MRPDSLAVHAGREELGIAHVPSIDLSTTYRTPILDEATENIDEMAKGHPPISNPIYQRLHNPTVDRLEKAMSVLEGAEATVSFASGMATDRRFIGCQNGWLSCRCRSTDLWGHDHLLAWDSWFGCFLEQS